MTITYDHAGACATDGCPNQGMLFDLASVDGVKGSIVCGGCGVDFTDLCVPKE